MEGEIRTGRLPIAIAVVVVVLLAINVAMGYLFTNNANQALTEQINLRMLDIANTAADSLDGNAIASFTEDDQGAAEFRQAMDSLALFQENIELSNIYCMRETADGPFEIIVDPLESDPAHFGELAITTDALIQAGKGQPSVDKTPYTDRWGTFYSAYSPVLDDEGNVAGVVGVDFSAEWYEERVAVINRSAFANVIVSLVMAVLAVFVARRLSRVESHHADKLLQVIRYDDLTGLANTGYFMDLAQHARDEIRAKGRDPVFLYMDLVEFRSFNQKHGFAGGDRFLASFADYLVQEFGHERCGRFGQDHFAAVTDARNLESRLGAFVDGVVKVNDGKNVPVQIGVYVDTDPALSVGDCSDRAKIAREEAKHGYRSSYSMFDMDMLADSTRRQHVVDNIDRAIEEGWIEVYYQPIVRASTGKVCDEEALARWNDPEYGMLMPDEFIPALEGAKLAYKLDLHVLDQVLVKMKRLQDAGLMVVSSSINLSRNDFETCDIVEEVCRRVDASPFGREMINIEITETAVGRDLDFMGKQVTQFHELGFKVWMDDFGSEYSSLDYLQNLNFDLIKLDMRFMRQFDYNERSRIILTEIVKMAFALGIDTVVEGVETAEQVEFLQEAGCSMMQGFYFTKPISVEQILERYETGTAIGFENPDEAEYYSIVSRTNLYDASTLAREAGGELFRYFDALPMAVLEVRPDSFSVVRCNQPYRDYLTHIVPDFELGGVITFRHARLNGGASFIPALVRCATRQEKVSLDEVLPDGYSSHTFMRRVAVNPVTGFVAVALGVLSIRES